MKPFSGWKVEVLAKLKPVFGLPSWEGESYVFYAKCLNMWEEIAFYSCYQQYEIWLLEIISLEGNRHLYGVTPLTYFRYPWDGMNYSIVYLSSISLSTDIASVASHSGENVCIVDIHIFSNQPHSSWLNHQFQKNPKHGILEIQLRQHLPPCQLLCLTPVCKTGSIYLPFICILQMKGKLRSCH